MLIGNREVQSRTEEMIQHLSSLPARHLFGCAAKEMFQPCLTCLHAISLVSCPHQENIVKEPPLEEMPDVFNDLDFV